ELGAVLRLVLLLEESQRLATTDGLTGLSNRRAFGDLMRDEFARAERSGTKTSLLLLDLDHFKSINDTHGHGTGDAVLAAVAAALRGSARAHDIVARWGGEEFVITLADTDAARAVIAAERIRAAVESLVVTNDSGARMPLSVSIGVAERMGAESLE